MKLNETQALKVLDLRAKAANIKASLVKFETGGPKHLAGVATTHPDVLYNVMLGLQNLVVEQQALIDDILKEEGDDQDQ